jgi:hypothetical protein
VNVASEQRGLVGKLLILWLLALALVVVVAIDGVSILLARIHVAEVAKTAADAGIPPLEKGRPEEKILRASLAALTEADEDARLERFETTNDTVTVEVSDRAGTMLVGLFGLFDDLANVSASRTARASG